MNFGDHIEYTPPPKLNNNPPNQMITITKLCKEQQISVLVTKGNKYMHHQHTHPSIPSVSWGDTGLEHLASNTCKMGVT